MPAKPPCRIEALHGEGGAGGIQRHGKAVVLVEVFIKLPQNGHQVLPPKQRKKPRSEAPQIVTAIKIHGEIPGNKRLIRRRGRIKRHSFKGGNERRIRRNRNEISAAPLHVTANAVHQVQKPLPHIPLPSSAHPWESLQEAPSRKQLPPPKAVRKGGQICDFSCHKKGKACPFRKGRTTKSYRERRWEAPLKAKEADLF